MKKILSVVLTICIAACVFAACSKNKSDENSHSAEDISVITTDNAKITEIDAVNLIKEQYTANELGLSQDSYENGTFMVSSSGVEHDGNYYIKVVNAIKQEHKDKKGNLSYTFDIRGEYLISFDGNSIIRKDMQDVNGETFIEMEVREVPETTAAAEQSSDDAE